MKEIFADFRNNPKRLMAFCLWMSNKRAKTRVTQLLKAKQILNIFTILNTVVLNNVKDNIFCPVL